MAYPYFNPYSIPQYPPQSGMIWASEQEAQTYPIAPNSAVTLWDRDKRVIYLKQADATGRATMRVLDYTERTASQTEAAPGADTTATKQDAEAILAALKGIEALLKKEADENV